VDDNTIVATVVPRGVTPGSAPTRPMGTGPKISDNTAGLKSQSRTFPDLLKVRAGQGASGPAHVGSGSPM